jgi:hypothetical protein
MCEKSLALLNIYCTLHKKIYFSLHVKCLDQKFYWVKFITNSKTYSKVIYHEKS